MKCKVMVPWYNPDQLVKFLDAWAIERDDPRVHFQQDLGWKNCAHTKNHGVKALLTEGVDDVIVLDDDCFPNGEMSLDEFMAQHQEQLNSKQDIPLFRQVTYPASRGTPYQNRHVQLPVAACMGFWTNVGDYDAPAQLIYGATTPMSFDTSPIYGSYFPLCGMNLSFKPAKWWPWCKFINAPRFDDIWQGFLWQKQAYAEWHCFSLKGPLVHHSRQSNVWANLRDESMNLERNETLWSDIFFSPQRYSYADLKNLMPVPEGDND